MQEIVELTIKIVSKWCRENESFYKAEVFLREHTPLSGGFSTVEVFFRELIFLNLFQHVAQHDALPFTVREVVVTVCNFDC